MSTHTHIHTVHTYSTYVYSTYMQYIHTPPGPSVSGVELNLGNMMKAKDDSVGQLTTGVAALFKMNKVRIETFPSILLIAVSLSLSPR